MRFPGLPDSLWRHGRVLCFEVCDWSEPKPGSAWVDLAEGIATALRFSPVRGYALSGQRDAGRIQGPEARGTWARIRKRAGELLGEYATLNVVDLNTGYDYTVGESERDGYVLMQSGRFPLAKSQLGIAVGLGLATTVDQLVNQVAPILRDTVRPGWGGVFAFPIAAGASFYLGDAGYSGPEVRALGPAAVVLAEHEARLNRASRRSSTEFSYSSGYVREVFEINFFCEAHLRAPLLGSTVRKYTERVGKLIPSRCWLGLWEWRLDDQELRKARVDWEESGLVLAAEHEPFRWQ